MQPERRVGTAVVGYGFAGRSFHTYLVGLVPGLRLVGVCARDPEKRARAEAERGVRTWGSVAEMLGDTEVELVVLATPHATHAPLAIEALGAGRHVVTDKLIACTAAEAEAMYAAAERAGRRLDVFHNRRFDGDFLTVKRLVEGGDLGVVRWVELAWQNFGPPRGWRGAVAEGGGRLNDLGAHLVDQALLLFPEPVAGVQARVHHDFPPGTSDTESHALVVVAFEGGRTAVIDVSSQCAAKKPRWLVCGDRGTFVKHGLDPQEKAMIAGDIDAAQEDPAQHGRIVTRDGEVVVPTERGRWRTFYERVAAGVTGGGPTVVKREEMRRLMEVLDAARRRA